LLKKIKEFLNIMSIEGFCRGFVAALRKSVSYK